MYLWSSLFKLELHYEHAHEEISSSCGSYYYLSFIGTHPSARGKGYGSLLLKHITDRADAEQRWCLLEATSERSQALYARHGFETFEVYKVDKSCPPVFFMKRQPQQPKQQQQEKVGPLLEVSTVVDAGDKLAAAVEVKGDKMAPAGKAEDGAAKIAAVHDIAALSNQDLQQQKQQQEGKLGAVAAVDSKSLYQSADARVVISGGSISSGSSDGSSSSGSLNGLVEEAEVASKEAVVSYQEQVQQQEQQPQVAAAYSLAA